MTLGIGIQFSLKLSKPDLICAALPLIQLISTIDVCCLCEALCAAPLPLMTAWDQSE